MRKAIYSLTMKSLSRSPLPIRLPKRKRSDAELQDLSRVMGADWTPGDMVHTWIHKHEGRAGELSLLVEEGWLWEDISRAMHLAGITYSSGRPIPAHTLRLKAYLSRNRERDRAAAAAAKQSYHPTPAAIPPVVMPVAAAAMQAPALPPASTTTESGPLASGACEQSRPDDPVFRLVTLKSGHQPPDPQRQHPSLPNEQPETTKISDQEILRRVFGKP